MAHVEGPVELIDRIKRIKTSKMNVCSVNLRKKLYNLGFDLGSETASQFWGRLNLLMRASNNAKNSDLVTKSEKLDVVSPALPNM